MTTQKYQAGLLKGTSMWPLLKEGDMVIYKKVTVDQLNTGDLIAFESNKMKICHRLVEKRNRKGKIIVVERGDNQSGFSKILESDQICGRVVEVFRGRKQIAFNKRSMTLFCLFMNMVFQWERIVWLIVKRHLPWVKGFDLTRRGRAVVVYINQAGNALLCQGTEN